MLAYGCLQNFVQVKKRVVILRNCWEPQLYVTHNSCISQSHSLTQVQILSIHYASFNSAVCSSNYVSSFWQSRLVTSGRPITKIITHTVKHAHIKNPTFLWEEPFDNTVFFNTTEVVLNACKYILHVEILLRGISHVKWEKMVSTKHQHKH